MGLGAGCWVVRRPNLTSQVLESNQLCVTVLSPTPCTLDQVTEPFVRPLERERGGPRLRTRSGARARESPCGTRGQPPPSCADWAFGANPSGNPGVGAGGQSRGPQRSVLFRGPGTLWVALQWRCPEEWGAGWRYSACHLELEGWCVWRGPPDNATAVRFASLRPRRCAPWSFTSGTAVHALATAGEAEGPRRRTCVTFWPRPEETCSSYLCPRRRCFPTTLCALPFLPLVLGSSLLLQPASRVPRAVVLSASPLAVWCPPKVCPLPLPFWGSSLFSLCLCPLRC